jgi:hypothetical protein
VIPVPFPIAPEILEAQPPPVEKAIVRFRGIIKGSMRPGYYFATQRFVQFKRSAWWNAIGHHGGPGMGAGGYYSGKVTGFNTFNQRRNIHFRTGGKGSWKTVRTRDAVSTMAALGLCIGIVMIDSRQSFAQNRFDEFPSSLFRNSNDQASFEENSSNQNSEVIRDVFGPEFIADAAEYVYFYSFPISI